MAVIIFITLDACIPYHDYALLLTLVALLFNGFMW
jgi:hypothetical protein